MIKVYAKLLEPGPFKRFETLSITRGETSMEFDSDEIEELIAVMEGKRVVLSIYEHKGDYQPKEAHLCSHD